MKKNVKHINESQLRTIVAESVKKVLREMNEGAITIGSPEDGHGYHVTIALDSLGPYAEFDVYGAGTDAQAAVDAAVDYLDKQGETGYFWDGEEQAQEYPDDFFTAGNYCHQLRRDLIHIEPIGGLNESLVKKVLREGYGQESVYQTICNLEEDLKTIIANTDNSSSQAFGSPEEKLKMIANQLSHVDKNIANQASVTFKKLMEVISELQDLRINLKTYGSKNSYWGHNFKTPNGTIGLSNYR